MIKKFKEHFFAKWYLYLIWAAVAALLWSWIFGLLTRPDDNEKVTVFVGTPYCEQQQLEAELKKDTPQYLRETEVLYFNPDNYNFEMFFTVKSPESDVFILTRDVIESAGVERFLSFEKSAAEAAFGSGVGLLEVDGAYYGVKLDGAKDYIRGDEERGDIYILFNKNSPHTGGLSAAEFTGATEIAGRITSL